MRLTGLALGLACLVHAPPLRADASLVAEGQLLYQDFCEICHGANAATGDSGDIRGLGVDTVRIALRGIEDMPPFDLTGVEIDAIVAYLSSLSGA